MGVFINSAADVSNAEGLAEGLEEPLVPLPAPHMRQQHLSARPACTMQPLLDPSAEFVEADMGKRGLQPPCTFRPTELQNVKALLARNQNSL